MTTRTICSSATQMAFDRLNQKLGLDLPLKKFSGYGGAGKFFITRSVRPSHCRKICPPVRPLAANAAVAALRDGAERCLRRELDALVTAPVNKEAIIRAGHKFVGQTEFLSGTRQHQTHGHDAARPRRTGPLAARGAGHDSHLHQIGSRKMTPEKITLAIELAAQACRDLGLPRAKIAVCGLNPHAGEGGEFGDEEIKTIAPTVLAAQKRGLDVVGPLSGDTVFHYALRGDFDAVVAMYHDQGLAPLKAVAFDTGVNWTLGLPFIRTSPDHGTAYDIAGKGIANPSSMIAAIRLAKQLAKNQKVGAARARAAESSDGGAASTLQPINSRIFDPMSPPRIRDSPTRIALAPHFFNRSTSARV